MKNILVRAKAKGIKHLVLTADMPTPGARYKDRHSCMEGPFAASKRILQAVTKIRWAITVGLLGRPLDLGNVSTYLGKKMNLGNYTEWLAKKFDPSIGWHDIEWIREFWHDTMIIKGY